MFPLAFYTLTGKILLVSRFFEFSWFVATLLHSSEVTNFFAYLLGYSSSVANGEDNDLIFAVSLFYIYNCTNIWMFW